MIDFTIETRINRPPDAVFAYATDPAKLGTWQTNTVSATQEGDGPIGVGTRLREVHRMTGGKQVPSVVEVSEYEPDRLFALHVIEGTPIDARIAFEPTPDGGTTLRFRVHGRLSGPARLAQPLLGRVLRRQFARDCATLRAVLEDGRPAAAQEPAPRARSAS